MNKYSHRIDELLAEVIEESRGIGIPVSRKIFAHAVINTRARKRFGCCRKEKTPFADRYVIEISGHILNAPEKRIKEVLAHEVLHTCYGCYNHGERWKKYARQMNENFGYEIARTTDYEAFGVNAPKTKRVVRYKIICTKCGNVIERERSSKVTRNPSDYRCARCNGSIIVKKVL